MKKRKVGQSDIEISELSLGCMSLPPKLEDAKPVIEMALEQGINYFDTADLYDRGANEEILGQVLKPHRKEVILATKVGNRWHEDKDGWFWDASPEHIKNGLKMSLRRLQTDYIDLYQLHGGTIDDSWDEIIETFEDLKKEGLIRQYGISSIRPNVFTAFTRKSNCVSNMMQYSMLDRRAEEWFDLIASNGTSVVTRGSIAKGLLTKAWRRRLDNITSYMSYSKEELTRVLEQLESEYEDIHAAALAFNLSHPAIASTVIGARTTEQLLENVKAYEKAKDINNIANVNNFLKRDIYQEHR